MATINEKGERVFRIEIQLSNEEMDWLLQYEWEHEEHIYGDEANKRASNLANKGVLSYVEYEHHEFYITEVGEDILRQLRNKDNGN